MRTDQTANGALRAAEFTTSVAPGGLLQIPAGVRSNLELRPGSQVKVVLLRIEDTAEEKARLEKEQQQCLQQLEELRQHFSGMDVNLTDALLEARAQEDAAL